MNWSIVDSALRRIGDREIDHLQIVLNFVEGGFRTNTSGPVSSPSTSSAKVSTTRSSTSSNNRAGHHPRIRNTIETAGHGR